MTRRRARLWDAVCIVLAGCSAIVGAAAANWWLAIAGVAGIVANVVAFGFDGAGPLGPRFARHHARIVADLIDVSLPVLHDQAQDRPEAAEQIGWTADSVAQHRDTLKAFADGNNAITPRQAVALCDRVNVELAPSAEQIAVDHPTRFNRYYARNARRRAARWTT